MNDSTQNQEGPEIRLVTGKGGVGKTSVAAAIATAASRAGKRVLLLELGAGRALGQIYRAELADARMGLEPIEVAPRLSVACVPFGETLEAFLAAQMRVRAVARRLANSDTLRRFFDTAPAVYEVLFLWRLQQLAAGDSYDEVVVDLDATGHALMMLSLPDVFERVAPSGPFRRMLDGFGSLVDARSGTSLSVVTLPDALPVSETRELHAELSKRADRVRLGAIYVNRMPHMPFDDADLALIFDDEEVSSRALPAADVALARRAVARFRRAEEQRVALGSLPQPIVALPEVHGSPRERIDALAAALVAASPSSSSLHAGGAA